MITRTELEAAAYKSVSLIADEIEKDIDSRLRKHVANRGMAGFVTFAQGSYSDAVMTELLSRYKKEYRTEYVLDQREGNFLQIWVD